MLSYLQSCMMLWKRSCFHSSLLVSWLVNRIFLQKCWTQLHLVNVEWAKSEHYILGILVCLKIHIFSKASGLPLCTAAVEEANVPTLT